jgi:hypothetical protein
MIIIQEQLIKTMTYTNKNPRYFSHEKGHHSDPSSRQNKGNKGYSSLERMCIRFANDIMTFQRSNLRENIKATSIKNKKVNNCHSSKNQTIKKMSKRHYQIARQGMPEKRIQEEIAEIKKKQRETEEKVTSY